jgi:hypothetical protein
MLVYLSSFNIFIDCPLTLFNQSLARVYQIGYTHWTMHSDHAPQTVRASLLFPVRRTLNYEDFDRNVVFTWTTWEFAAFNFYYFINLIKL